MIMRSLEHEGEKCRPVFAKAHARRAASARAYLRKRNSMVVLPSKIGNNGPEKLRSVLDGLRSDHE
jgi:hypothetical protein